MKKTLALLLAAMMIIALFAGCGTGSASTSAVESSAASEQEPAAPAASEAEAEPEAEPEEEAEPEDPYYINLPLVEETAEFSGMMVWIPFMETAYPDGIASHPYWAELENRTNVHFEWNGVAPANYRDQLNILVAANTLPDIIQNFGSYYTGGYDLAIEEEVIIDLVDYKDVMVNFFKAIDDLGIQKDIYTAEGHIGYAGQIYDQTFVECGPISYAEWLDALELDSPVTIDDYYEMIQAMKVEYDAQMWLDMYGSSQCSVFASAYGVMSYDNGGTTSYFQVDENGTVSFGPTMDGYKSYLELMSKWYSEGLILTDLTNQSQQGSPETSRDVAGLKISMFANTVGGMNSAYLSAEGEYPSEIGLHAPVLEEGQMLHIGRPGVQVTPAGFSVSTNCEDPELLCRWLDYGYSEEGQLFENWGYEGETYTVNADGTYSYTELITANEEFGGMALNCILTQFPASIKPLAAYLSSLKQNCVDAIELWTSCTDNAYLYPSTATMTADESADFSSAYADIKTRVQEYTLNCIMNGTDVDATWDEYVQNINDLGLENCIALKQAAYDRYLAK